MARIHCGRLGGSLTVLLILTICFPGLPSLTLTFVFVGTIPMEVLSSQPVKEASLESELLKSVVLFDVYNTDC